MARAIVAPVTRLTAETRVADADLVAVEAPLRLQAMVPGRAEPRPLGLLMRTPGDDEELMTGWLVGEGILRAAADLVGIVIEEGADGAVTARATLSGSASFDDRWPQHTTASTSACGLCGRLELLAADRAGQTGRPGTVDAGVLAALPEQLRGGQAVFAQTGGLHAAALFTADGGPLFLREDVGRHNAVDKVVGAAWAAGVLPDPALILAVSGRVAYEIVQKCAAAGIGALVAVGAPSSLAVEAARAVDLVLAGFARDGRANVYAGASRLR